ncbi:hypothetical protein QBC38DRAFT_483674 [Podospora fimiseda]|uniref:Nucleoside phosphorylase domain-containing protein n=1 Tax=Podospora fimiseda TaxID=252190 RepID=A0AAN7GYM4_9PEZI|nr:hypothetical protein QBC38DRAFT_483674 [Podospora fimiseda]
MICSPFHGCKLYPRQDINVNTHTMGSSLPQYLKIKVHQEVLRKRYDEIIVMGSYSRYSTSSIPFQGEKRDKPFNWERPSARPSEDGKILYIECFPGYDHIEHYAEIISSYLRILESPGPNQRTGLTPSSRVSFIPSSCSDTLTALELDTNLLSFPGEGVDTVILGMTWHLSNLTAWPSVQFEGNGPWQWIIRHYPSSNRRVAFLGFRPAFWGCISGEVIHLLSRQFPAIREFIYIGKLGTLTPGIRPNHFLATGSHSLLNNRIISWENCLSTSISQVAQESVIVGKHVTLGSVLHETKEWYASHRRDGMDFDFVDPEIGNMAQAAVRSGRRYGYLHLITDNLGQKYDEDLSNERTESVLKGRKRLYEVIRDVMEFHLTRTDVEGKVVV